MTEGCLSWYNISMETQKLVQRLLKNSTLDTDTQCWEWNKSKGKWGYGHINVKGKIELAHRVSYRTLVGEIISNNGVLHKCDNPACVNPDHLFTGTNKDNVLDKVRKNRQSRIGQGKGENHSLAKLTEQDVLNIRASGDKQESLAKKYNVTQSCISHIKNKKSWSHI